MDEYEAYVEVEVVSTLQDLADGKKDAEELTWKHAHDACKVMGVEIGSEEFILIYRGLAERYSNNINHLKFFMLTAMMTVKKLLDDNSISIPLHNGEEPTTRDVAQKIAKITEQLMASYLWVTAGENLWPTNDELPEEIAVSYLFSLDDVNIEED